MAETISHDVSKPIVKKTKSFTDFIIIGLLLFGIVLFILVFLKARTQDKITAGVIAGVIIAIFFIMREKDKPPSLIDVANKIRNKLGNSAYGEFLNTNPTNICGMRMQDSYWVEFRNDAKVVKFNWKNGIIEDIRRGNIESILKELKKDELQKALLFKEWRIAKTEEELEGSGYEVPE